MNKSTGFFISMLIFVVGVIAVIASMILGGLDKIDMAVLVCQAVTVLCMVGLLALKLGKAEKYDEKGEEFFIEQDDEFAVEPDDEDETDDIFYEDTNDEYIIHDDAFSRESALTEDDFEEPAEEEEISEKSEHAVAFDDSQDLDLDVPEFEEEHEELQTGLFKQSEFVEEPEFAHSDEVAIEETAIEGAVIEDAEEAAEQEQKFPTEAEPAFEEDELRIDMDPLIEQVFAEPTEQDAEIPATEAVQPRAKRTFKVAGVRRVKNYSVPMPKKIKLKK